MQKSALTKACLQIKMVEKVSQFEALTGGRQKIN